MCIIFNLGRGYLIPKVGEFYEYYLNGLLLEFEKSGPAKSSCKFILKFLILKSSINVKKFTEQMSIVNIIK